MRRKTLGPVAQAKGDEIVTEEWVCSWGSTILEAMMTGSGIEGIQEGGQH